MLGIAQMRDDRIAPVHNPFNFDRQPCKNSVSYTAIRNNLNIVSVEGSVWIIWRIGQENFTLRG